LAFLASSDAAGVFAGAAVVEGAGAGAGVCCATQSAGTESMRAPAISEEKANFIDAPLETEAMRRPARRGCLRAKAGRGATLSFPSPRTKAKSRFSIIFRVIFLYT
jgi:hypothetical protein